MDYQSYFLSNKDKHLQELGQLISIPSISALSEHKSDMNRAAEWVADSLHRAGMEQVEIYPTDGHPIVYGEHVHAPGKPTVLVYGHYDVQPVDPLELWESPPFEPTIRDNKLFARGATDDKGQIFLHIKAAEALLQLDKELPVNLKFCIEGEEEVTSPNLPFFLTEHQDKLAADVVLISDTALLEPGKPAICTGLRGLCSLEVSVRTANTDLHSGTYGGGVPNSLHVLVDLLASLHDKQGRVAVEGFYEGVPEMTDLIRDEIEKLQFSEEGLKQTLALDTLYGEEGFGFIARTGVRPTLELNGVYGGFQGEGTKTVIPKEAHAKITCRLVGDQDPQDVLDKIEAHLQSRLLPGAKLEVKQLERARAFTIDPSDPMLQKAADAYEKVYGTRALFTKDGGSIPIVETLSRVLKAPAVMMGFGLPNENLHAPNEHFHLENFDKGLLTIVEYLKSL
ncbi:peptidase M20 [Paenibacillus antibioticophila]|uniref:Peptidase M20 n=1 Tax=Paenibacillus antibioticophila TaxID=1274374 RepID=A0A920CJG3_9BACL|nr:dipeptidase [Paenibacillus antibioticophila]GIO38877.1 peptidase M20 [Paenibacillus antibioticophila]